MEPELREMSTRLRRLQHDLKVSVDGGGRGVTFVCQHAITTTISPWIVKRLTKPQDVSVRVRSGNRDNCLMLLLSREADFAITYECPGDPGPFMPRAFDSNIMGEDFLVPVTSPGLMASFEGMKVPTITYPPDVFLGRIMAQCILPSLPEGMVLAPKAETALTLAACEYALGGIGLAWLPMTLVRRHLENKELVHIDHLPEQKLNITLIRLSDQQSDENIRIWEHLTTPLDTPGPS